VTVPGAVDGWWKMHQKFGRLPWAELFAPAIHYARNGFPVTEIIHEDWATSGAKWPGRVPAVGEIWKHARLGPGLRNHRARQGRDGFYKGPLAADIVKTSERLGGLLASNDFTEYESEFVEPISTTYRAARVFELPPNGQGVSALEMLNILETRPGAQLDLHFKIEAQKLSVMDLRRYVTDPKFASIPTDGLLSKSNT
jgi:gamma-glutamyltranspeptidase/glutathione hydrolase